jgi:KDO2-lipid IV(A) lauroyltransferase
MLSLMRLLARCPLWLLHAAGVLLGWLGYALSPSYRARLRENAARAGLSAAHRRAAVGESGKLVTELPRLWLRPADVPLGETVRWAGHERMAEWARSPRGLILLTPHLGTFEICAQAYAEAFGAVRPLTVLYRPARKAWLRELEETARARPHLATAPANLAGVRQMLKALRRGEAVGLLPDQVPPEGQGVWAPFFGHPAYTMTLATRLARQTGARMGLMWTERQPGGAGWVVHVQDMPPGPWDQPAPADDAESLDAREAAALNRAMEDVIRRCPTQYLWGYHRYKAPRSAA